jgi:GTPase Era involved in 16S rRNA processing
VLEETNLEIPYSRIIKTEKNTVNSDRFRPVEFSDIDKCLEENENENTNKKTLSDIRLFKSYLVNTGENTEIENMTAENLNEKFSTFLLSVTKIDGTEYEPSTLRGFMCSLDRYLRQRNSNINVNNFQNVSQFSNQNKNS